MPAHSTAAARWQNRPEHAHSTSQLVLHTVYLGLSMCVQMLAAKDCTAGLLAVEQ